MTSKQAVFLGICITIGILFAFLALKNMAWAPTHTEQPNTSSEITAYVTAHISELSPMHEQVGGTFYVTSIHVEAGTGTVSYEDGHNAYTADFTYSSDAQNTVRVDSFVVRE
jgi:hypothetical protein